MGGSLHQGFASVAEQSGHEAGDRLGQGQKPLECYKDASGDKGRTITKAQGQAIEGDQAFQDAGEGTHTSEEIEYIHNWKREIATQGGLAHLAHKPTKVFGADQCEERNEAAGDT